jgi:lipoprotein-releasing system ATP-binding protein
MSALLINFQAAKKAYMIQAINIQKFYGDLQVLKGVDLHIKKGEIVSIVGPSGAGKTTLLQILGTLDVQSNKLDSRLLINGIEVSDLSDKELARFRNEHIGFIFQFHQLLPEFTALENVCIPAYIKKTPKGEVEKRAKELLEFLGLSHRIHHKPNELSGGEQQRVAVARSLINNPSIIFADEPSGNLDSESADNLHKLFFELRDKFGQTFVIVTHNLELADLADRKLTMVDGRITDSVGIEWTDFTNRPLL